MGYLRIFDVKEGVLIPTEACLTVKSLKDVMEAFPNNYLKVYLYVFYKTCLDPERNPFFNFPEDEREEIILKEIQANFSLDSPVITKALEFCTKAYHVPTKTAYLGIKAAMERLGKYMSDTQITSGRDGNGMFILKAAGDYHTLWESFKGLEKEYLEEMKTQTRGNSAVAYDQK